MPKYLISNYVGLVLITTDPSAFPRRSVLLGDAALTPPLSSFSLDLFEAKNPMTAAPSLPPTWCRISRETKAARYRSLLAELITSDARKLLWVLDGGPDTQFVSSGIDTLMGQ